MVFPSVSGLVLLLTFVLPGYLARSVANRRVPLPKVSDFGLLLQAFLISVLINVGIALAWFVVHFLDSRFPALPLEPTPLGESSAIWAFVSVAASFGAALFLGSRDALVTYVVNYGKPTISPYAAYALYTVNADKLTTDADDPFRAWVAVTLNNGETVTGRVREYGLEGDDAQSLVLEKAEVWAGGSGQGEPRENALVYIPGSSVVRVEIYYSNSANRAASPPGD